MTAAVLEIPFLDNALGCEMISWTEYAVAMALAFTVIPIVESVKFFQRKAAKEFCPDFSAAIRIPGGS